MNLKLGEIEINGITLNRDTSIEEVINKFHFCNCLNTDEEFILFMIEQAIVDRCLFFVDIYFINKFLDKIEMTPIHLKMKDPQYPCIKYQAEKKKVCDLFLKKNLGEPTTTTDAFVFYEYDWGSICSITFLKGRDEYTGGYIEIKYNKKQDGNFAI